MRTVLQSQLERESGLRQGQIVCYTYGAPRCGNHAWRQYVAERVPELWHVINDHDIVAKGLKFGFLYKRCGHRVVVRGSGRLAVRPSFFEFLLLQVRCPAVACDCRTLVCRMLVSLTRCRDWPFKAAQTCVLRYACRQVLTGGLPAEQLPGKRGAPLAARLPALPSESRLRAHEDQGTPRERARVSRLPQLQQAGGCSAGEVHALARCAQDAQMRREGRDRGTSACARGCGGLCCDRHKCCDWYGCPCRGGASSGAGAG